MAEPQKVFNECSSGVITGVKAELAPPNSVDLGINLVYDDIYGEARARKGVTILGTATGGSDEVTGLYQFNNTAGTITKLQKVVAGKIYHYTASTWTDSSQADTTGLATRFITFLDIVARLNGTDAVVCSANGTSWGAQAALDSANFPVGGYGTVYKDQVIVAGVSGDEDTLYISSVPSAGAISWTVNNRTITINPEDGQNITAFGEIGGLLLVWKDRSMYTWNNRATEADELVNVGCSSQESVALCGNALAFFNNKGVWLTNGSQPVKISRPVQKWIEGMSSSYYSSVSAYGDEDHLFVSIGDCTVDTVAYTNVVLRYSINTKEWAVFSYAYEFKIFSLNDNDIVGGDDSGDVYQIESSALNDNSIDIKFDLQSHDMFWGSRGLKKEITERALAYSKDAQALLQVKIDDGDWKTIGTMVKDVSNFNIKQPLSGFKFKFRIVGISTNRARLQGVELPKIVGIDY